MDGLAIHTNLSQVAKHHITKQINVNIPKFFKSDTTNCRETLNIEGYQPVLNSLAVHSKGLNMVAVEATIGHNLLACATYYDFYEPVEPKVFCDLSKICLC